MANENQFRDTTKMVRPIDANALVDLVLNHPRPYRRDFYAMINNAPTVDAVEVVHGRWECTYDAELGETDVTCSHCKSTRTINGCYVTSTGESCYFEDNYCPNCGADMRGKEDA